MYSVVLKHAVRPFLSTSGICEDGGVWDYIANLLRAHEENPSAFGDDLGLHESANEIADILDEVRFGLQHLIRPQNADGGAAPGAASPEELSRLQHELATQLVGGHGEFERLPGGVHPAVVQVRTLMPAGGKR